MNLFRQHKLILAFVVLLTVSILVGRSFYQSKYSLICTSYRLQTDKIQEPVRILQITDLHNSMFGEKNEEFIDLAVKQSSDLILITGDLLNSSESRTDISTDLISDLCSIAPVYISLGNHDMEYKQNYGIDIVQLYEDAGAIVLDRQYQDIIVNGQKIRLGGIYGYCLPEKYLETNEADPEECTFLLDFQNTDLYTVLMCHMPVCWLINDGLDEWDVDCVFSGHIHGGQVRLPFIGGLYAPDQGFFPGRVVGLYKSNDETKALVLSRGLGNTEKVPRFNNRPEIVVVDFLPQE